MMTLDRDQHKIVTLNLLLRQRPSQAAAFSLALPFVYRELRP